MQADKQKMAPNCRSVKNILSAFRSGVNAVQHMQTEYEDRLVAFIDILGWTSATSHVAVPTLLETLNPIIERAKSYSVNHKEFLHNSAGIISVNPLFLAVEFCFFSDCFVVSMPISMGGRIYDFASEVSRELLLRGFAVRGGITAGKLFQKEQVVFGPALIQAYKLECSVAKMAKIHIDSTALVSTGHGDHMAVCRDEVGDWVVDLFPIQAIDRVTHQPLCCYDHDMILEKIALNLESLAIGSSSRRKWEYLARTVADSLSKFEPKTRTITAKLRSLAPTDTFLTMMTLAIGRLRKLI